jgi:hypothetical protein
MTATLNARKPTVALPRGLERDLVRLRELEGRTLVVTPAMLPSGTLVTIAVEPASPSAFRLSDLGLGHAEAALIGAERTYAARAARLAEATGALYARGEFTLPGLAASEVSGGITILANAVLRAVLHATEHGVRHAERSRRARLSERLATLFPTARIESDQEFIGDSGHAWTVDTRVTRDGHQFVLELLTYHPGSLAAATTKFHDIARLPEPPGRIAVVPNKRELGTWLGVISQAAAVVEDDAPDRTWERALAA